MMRYDELVSVIVPVYNVERYIEEAIQSVLMQTYENIELVLVNDGSTDMSGEMCKQYANKDTRITYLTQENAGVSAARNVGLQHATGTYVYFMDSDDTIDVNFIKSSVQIAVSDDADIVILGEYFVRRYPNTPALPTWAMLLKRSFLVEYPNVRFPEGIQPCEDGLFSHQLFALSRKVALNPAAIYFYRQHENQNHKSIHANKWNVLRQIPDWFNVLTSFYSTYNLLQSHKQHLLLFLEHEPFEFRYLKMDLDDEQKLFLFELIKKFATEHALMEMHRERRDVLSRPFQVFLSSRSHRDFDHFYKHYLRRRAYTYALLLFLNKLTPWSKQRRKFRQKIYSKYQF